MLRKEWNHVLDDYLSDNEMTVAQYEDLDEMQITVIQEIKKARKRLNKTQEKKTY